MVVVSTPEMGPDGNGGYTFPTMERLAALARRHAGVTLAFDRAGSLNTYPADKERWDALFHKGGGPNATVLVPSSVPGPIERYKALKGPENGAEWRAAMEEMRKGIKATQWWASYTAQVKATVIQVCNSNSNSNSTSTRWGGGT